MLREVRLLAGSRLKWSLEKIRGLLKEGLDGDLTVEELNFYLGYCANDYRSGETYELLSEIERTLHTQIREVLTDKHGQEETGWWRNGVPPSVRKECASAREEDELFSGDDAYAYTTLIHLWEILDKRWRLFEGRVPSAVSMDKKARKNDLVRLNGIRNKVMHPVRAAPPSDEDLKFVKRMHETLHRSKWRKRQTTSAYP